MPWVRILSGRQAGKLVEQSAAEASTNVGMGLARYVHVSEIPEQEPPAPAMPATRKGKVVRPGKPPLEVEVLADATQEEVMAKVNEAIDAAEAKEHDTETPAQEPEADAPEAPAAAESEQPAEEQAAPAPAPDEPKPKPKRNSRRKK